MPKRLKLISERCIGCKSCELACSLTNAGEINPAKSRITEITFVEGKYTLPYNLVSTCRQCADAPCLTSCPVKAISRTSVGKAVIIDPKKCIGCGKCLIACPFGAMLFDSSARKAFKCELCAGNPACASICPVGAILYKNEKPFYAKAEDLKMKGIEILSQLNLANLKKRQKPD
jgi:carbon-monoxide dehydrogenase iron sulfur subunit